MRHTGRRLTALLAAAGLACGLTLAGPMSPASASFCQTAGPYKQSAYMPSSVNIFGGQGNISRSSVANHVCGQTLATSGGAATVYTMLNAKSASNSNTMYALAGWGFWGGINQDGAPQGVNKFAQYTAKCYATNTCTGSPFITAFDTTNPPEGYTYYDAYRNNSTGKLTMRTNGVTLLTSGYDPFGDWVTAWQVQYTGQTKYAEDWMPGTFQVAGSSDTIPFWPFDPTTPSGAHVSVVGMKTVNSAGSFVSYHSTMNLRRTVGSPIWYLSGLFGGGADPWVFNQATDIDLAPTPAN